MKLFSFFKPKNKVDKIQDGAEKEFAKGNIILPTGLRDYENYREFKTKTSHLPKLKEKLELIELKNGK
jgi:hypothetical protein